MSKTTSKRKTSIYSPVERWLSGSCVRDGPKKSLSPHTAVLYSRPLTEVGSSVRGGERKLRGSCSISHSLSSALSLHSLPLRWGCCCVARRLYSPARKGRQGPASRSSAPGLSASLSQVLTKRLAVKPSVYLYGKIISSHQILSVC